MKLRQNWSCLIAQFIQFCVRRCIFQKSLPLGFQDVNGGSQDAASNGFQSIALLIQKEGALSVRNSNNRRDLGLSLRLPEILPQLNHETRHGCLPPQNLFILFYKLSLALILHFLHLLP